MESVARNKLRRAMGVKSVENLCGPEIIIAPLLNDEPSILYIYHKIDGNAQKCQINGPVIYFFRHGFAQIKYDFKKI